VFQLAKPVAFSASVQDEIYSPTAQAAMTRRDVHGPIAVEINNLPFTP
jgi:hypothetical protein